MIPFHCRCRDKTHTPIIRNEEIWAYAEALVQGYKPSLLKEPSVINVVHFLESYLGATVEYQDIYYEKGESPIAGATVFNDDLIRVFDREGQCTRCIEISAGTIIIDNAIVDTGNKGYEAFTGLHEGGHFVMHPEVYRRNANQISFFESPKDGRHVVCCRKNTMFPRYTGRKLTPAENREHQANTFAAFVAMPRQTFIPYASELIKDAGFSEGIFVYDDHDWESSMPDDAGHYMELQKEQYDLIQAYSDGLGSFDNGILMRNISLLVKKYKLRMADLERMLGISTGYISRTAKENSGKRMSIDIAWKIARIFNVEMSTLFTVDMQELKGNTAVLLKFIDKLTKETEDGRLQWTSCGGEMCELDSDLINSGICEEAEDDKDPIYHPDHLNPDLIWRLTGDIMKAEHFGPDGEDLLMIPYRRDDNKVDNRRFFDFLFSEDGCLRHHEDYVGLEFRKVFYTDEDISGLLSKAAAHLHELAVEQEFDAKVDPEIRDFIEGYLG